MADASTDLILSLKDHVIPVEILSRRCPSMETVPIKMFDDRVTLVSFEIIHGDSCYTRAAYRFTGRRFEILQHFGYSIGSDPWMGEGYVKRAQLLKWILESIKTTSLRTSARRSSDRDEGVDP